MDLVGKVSYRHIHFVGIKGVAMTALALVAKELGIEISGSDVAEIFPTDETLARFGIKYTIGFAGHNIPANTDLVVYTGAHQGMNNPEVFEAKLRGIPVMPHARALGMFMEDKQAISVAGSHGKTTTSALIASVLMGAKRDPSFAIGCGAITHLKTSGHAGKGSWFVAEADEYVTDPGLDSTPRFLFQHPKIIVVTNIDYDHPDVYPNLQTIQDAFIRFIEQSPQDCGVVLNADNPATVAIIPRLTRRILTYGITHKANYVAGGIRYEQGQTIFSLVGSQPLGEFRLKIPGMHNVANAAGAVVALLQAGLTTTEISAGISSFVGTRRRFELYTERHGKLLYDDYAHHPVEIMATLAAAKTWYPTHKLTVIFQPHTYSRTQALLEQFAQSFVSADAVLLKDIYASAREQSIVGFSGQTLWERTKKVHKDVYYVPSKLDMLEYIKQNVGPNELLITMGAGDIFTLLPDIAREL
jgi:UDP-N-acetylmuramate--alanine ligase